MSVFSFQKLEIYSLSKELVKIIYELTNKFPDKEKFALVLQMNRAVISIPSNIAEGTSRKGLKDKLNFVNYSYSSLLEFT